ncbi:CC168 protein, partial [Crocuta crocuta]
MSREFYFFKRAVRNRLEDDTFLTLWELVESWTQNDWMTIFFIIFLGIIFEIILIKVYTSFQKKPALPEKGSSGAQKVRANVGSCSKYVLSDNSFTHCFLRFRVDDFSEKTITSSLKTEDNEGNFEDRVSPADEVIWSGTSESKYQVSYVGESHTPSSNGTSSLLSLFHSEVKDFFLSPRGFPENEHKTGQFSSKKLFSIMKTNKNKNPEFSSDFNFSRSSSISRESEDSREGEGLDRAPCPPAHLFLSRDQVRLLEENVRNQIPLKSKTTLKSNTTHPYSIPQESLIQNQHSVEMDTSAQAQDSFPVQNATQNQGFYEARFKSQAQQFVNSQPDDTARYFALPQDLTRKPYSSSTQDSFQTQIMGRSQHLINVPYSVETQDPIKGLESDTKHLHEAQYSVWFEDLNKTKHLMQGENAIFKNARFLVLTVSPNSFAEELLQIRSVKPEGQKQIASELNQYSVYTSLRVSPTLKRQKNRRKAFHSRSKLSLKILSQKSKKPPTPWVFQITVCHTSKPGKLGCKYNAKKKELHQRKGVSDITLHLLYVSKLPPPYIKKYSRKKLVKVTPGVTGCRHSLLMQNKSLDAENVNCVESVEKRGNLDNAKNVKQHGREYEGEKSISAKLPPQLEQSFMVSTFQLKAPCSSLIEMNWKNKESFKDPITQEKEIGIAEFHAPNSKKTSDLHIPKHETPLEEAVSEPWQKFASSREMKSNRRMETQEDLKSTENSHLPLSSGDELPTSLPETQRCFPNRNIQKQKDFLEIVLETSEVNLLISLGTKEQKSSEQLASVKTQESTEDIIMKERKPLILHVTECDNLSESESLACNTRININMQDKRIFATFHNATNTTISEQPDMKMHNRLKTKTDISTTGFSPSVVEQEKLPDEMKALDAKYIEERCIFKKPEEHGREEEEETFQEAVSQLKQDFRVSLQLRQKPKYVRFEIKQNSSGSRKTPNKEQEVQPQTFSIETIVGSSACPTKDQFQDQVKQSTDTPTGRETEDPKNPLTVRENSPVGEVLIDTTERNVPFGGSPRKIPDGHIAEEKENLKRVLPAAALGSFIIHMLPLSSFKRQKIRSKLSGGKTILSPTLVIMKVKKPANLLMPYISRHGMPSLRRKLRGNLKILFKQILQDKIVTHVLVNDTYPHVSTVPRLTIHSRFNVENHSHTKLNQEESEEERDEKYSAFIKKGNDSGNILEEAKLQDEVRRDKEAPPEAVLRDPWNLGLNANPKKELKTQEEMPQPVTSRESLVESVYIPIMDLFHVETMKKSLATQADLKCTADAKMPLPASEKSLIGEALNQTRESDVVDYGNDAKEMSYFFADTKAELPKDLPATYSETLSYYMPVLTHSKVNKNRVGFSHTESPVKPKSVPMNTVKPSISQVFNSTGKKLDSKLKVKSEKINHGNGLVYDFISSLFSPTRSRLHGETNSFCHTQLKQGQLAEEVRPQYVDFFDKCSTFHDQEEKVKDGEEVEQKTLLEAALQRMEHLWPDAFQGKETHLDEWCPALDSLTQQLPVNEQDVQHQRWFAQTTLQTGLHMAPREAEELWKTSITEHALTPPVGLKIPLPKAENSQGFLFNTYQKENVDLVKSDEQPKQPGGQNLQVQPQIHGTQTVLGSASCPILDQLQFGKLENYARFSPPKSEEVKNDEILFSAREYGVPSDANHQKEQAGGIEKKDTVAFDFCLFALSTPKKKRNFKYSDKEILVNTKYGLLKAKKPSVSNIFNTKVASSPNHRKELGCNPTTKMNEGDHGEKMAAKMYSFMSMTPDINMYDKIEREKDLLGERSLSAQPVKQAVSAHEGNITSDDTNESSAQDEEEGNSEQETLKVIPQYSQHFKFCSDQREELDLHQSENHGSGKILFIIDQDIPQQMQPTDSVQGEKPEKSHQAHNGAVSIVSSKLPPPKTKHSLIGQVLMDSMKDGVPSVGSHLGERYRHGEEENTGYKKDLQATVLESLKLRKSPRDREAWKASSTDTQNRSSNTMKTNVQHEKEEENIQRLVLDSVPHDGQHCSFSTHQMKNPGSHQSKSELNNSEVRRTWNLPCTAQKMKQEKCFRETILEPVSRHVMNFLQVETAKKRLLSQEGIKCVEVLKTPLPKARKSETGSIQCGPLWDGNPRRKWDNPIMGKKAWNQNDLRTVLKPTDFSSLDSSVPQSQSYTLEFVSKRSEINSNHVTWKAKNRPRSQLLNTTRCITGSHRKKKGCTFQYKMKKRQWIESVVEASLSAAEGTDIPPPKIVTDKHSFDTTARSTLYNRTLHKNLQGHTTEKEAELAENSATTFLGPLDFFTPILSDSESQINTVQLLGEKITLNIKCPVMKKKEPAISQILKIRRQFTTKHWTKPGSNLKTKMKQMRQDKNVANTFPNTIDFTPDTPDIERQNRFKIGIDRISRFHHSQPTHMELPTERLVISQILNATSHAALSNNEQQEKKIDRKREKTVLYVDPKSIHDSMPIFSHIKMEPSPSTWGIYEESSEKGNALNKTNTSSASVCTPVYPQIIKHTSKAKTGDVKDIIHTKWVKLKAKKPPVSQLFHTIRCRTRRNKKEQTHNTKKQKEFQQDKTVTDSFLSTICDSRSVSSQIKQFTEVEREKARPRNPIYNPPLEKSLNKRKMSSSASNDIKNTVSRNIKTLKQCIRVQKENRQAVLLDVLQPCRDQLVISQEVKKELDQVKIGVTLEREVYPGLASQKREIDYPRFDIPRIRTHTECEFLVAQRVKEEDVDAIERLVSIPRGREISEKTNASLSSKRQNIFLTELDASQRKTWREHELPKQGSISMTNLESVAYPIMKPLHFKNTGKIAEEDMYTNKKNTSHLLRREDIKETDILKGSKGQKFLYTSLAAKQNISAVQKGEVKPGDIPESVVDSVSCPHRDNHFQITPAVNTRKGDVRISINLYVNPWRKEQSKLTDSPIRLNEQKMIFSEKLMAKQLDRSNHNKENILESISSYILHQPHNETLKKNVSAKGMNSKVLSSVVDNASNEVDTPLDQPPCSGVNLHSRRKEPQKEGTCKALPTSVSYSSTEVLQIKLPCVKKVLKAPMYDTSNTEGIGLPVEEKEEQPECIHQISPKPASHSLRNIFQSKILCKEKASKEVVSTVDCIPSTEKIGSLITRKESKVQIGKGKSCMKLTSLCAPLPSLSQSNVNSRIKVGQDKSGILKSCLPPLKAKVSSNVRETLFAESINRDGLSNVIESKHLTQEEKEDGENIIYVKNIMGLKCVTLKGKKTPLKYILHGQEPQGNNREQEEMMQKDKSDLDIVQNKRHASIPSSPHLEWIPEIKEVLMRGIMGFCLPSLTLKELSDAMGICEEPTDDILSSIKKARYMPQKERVEMALEEIKQPKRIGLKAKQSLIAQELQLNIKENEKNMQEDKDNQVGTRNTSRISTSFPSSSEVDINIKGEEMRLIETRSSFLQLELQESSDIEKIAYKQSIYGDISNSINKAKEHTMQEEEERVKKEKAVFFREKKSPISQETQLDIEEEEIKIQKLKDEPNVLVTNTSTCISAPSHLKLDTRIKAADSPAKVTRYPLPELSYQKSSDAVKKANKESTDDDVTSDVQEAKEYMPQKEKNDVQISAERDVMDPKDKDLKRKKALSQDTALNLKEQVKVDAESEEQGGMDGGGKGEQEVVLPTHWASESSLTHRELGTRIEGEEDIQGITRSAVAHLYLQNSFDAGKVAYTKSTGEDVSKDVRVVQEYEPEKGEDRRKIVNMKYRMYPKGTASKEKLLPLPPVLRTSGSCGPQGIVQTNMQETLGNIRERSELDKLLTRTSLLQFKLNKGIEGKEEKEGITRPFLPPSWHKESSSAEKLKYTVPPLNGISSNSKRTKDMTQIEEDKANRFEGDVMHPKYIALRAKKSPLFPILKKKLQVNLKEQAKVRQEDNEETVVLLSKIHPFITSSTHLKWDTVKDEGGEPGIRNDVPHVELQESLPTRQIAPAPTDSPDSHVNKGEQHPQQGDRNRVQTEAMNGSMQPSDTDFKAKISPPPHVFSITEHNALNNRKEPQWSMTEKVNQEQQRTGDPDVALTKTPPSTPSPSHHSLDTRTKEDKDSLAIIGASPSQSLCPTSSDAGKTRHADSNEGVSSSNVVIKVYQPMPYTKVKNRVKIKDGEGRRFPTIITLRAEISSFPHLPSRKRLPVNIKEQGKEVQEGKSEPEMIQKDACASLPSPSYLKWDKQMNEKEHVLEKMQFSFPPLKIQDPSNSGKKAYTKSFDGELKEKDRLKIDSEDKMVPTCVARKAKELPLSHILGTKKLRWKIKEQERKVQKKKNDLVKNLGNMHTSLLTLPYLKFGTTEEEGHRVRITSLPLPQLQSKQSLDAVKTEYAETTDRELSNDVKELKEHTLQKEVKDGEKNMDVNSIMDPNDRYLKAKKSPILLRYNLSDHQWKTKEQEGMAREGQHEPDGTILTKTCRASLLHLYKNTRGEKKRTPILTRSSLSPVNFQESSDSEDMESVEPIARDILTSAQKRKHHIPPNKEGDRVETVNLMFIKHQEKKMQESNDEPGVVLANSSLPSSSLPHLQLDKEVQVDDEMLVLTRSVVQKVSNAGEIVHTEAIGGDVMQDSQNEKQHVPQEEEQDREKIINVRSMTHTTGIILKSKKSPPSHMLHRTELHLIIGGQEPKKHEGQGKLPCTVLRKIYVSKPSANLTLDKGTQVDEKRLGIRRPSLLPCMLSALSGTEKRADTRAVCDVRKRKQHTSQKEKKYEVKTVDMRIRMHHKEARISSISHIFNTKGFVLNIKEQKENVCRGKDELPVVLTRTFLSIPSAPPLYLDAGSKIVKDVPGATGSSPLQQNLQEPSDTQKTPSTEAVAGESEIVVKKTKHSRPQEETLQQWTSNFMISAQRRSEPPRVKSEGDLRLLVLNSRHEDIYLTGFGNISGKRLEYFFTGQEARPEKYKTEAFTTFLSYPTMDPAKMGNLKKEAEIMDNINHKMSLERLVSPPRKLSKEIYVTFGTPVRAKGFSVLEQDAHQQKTLSKAPPGSSDSYTSDKSETEVQNHDKMSKMLSSKALAPQTKGSLEKMNITESDTPPIVDGQEIVVQKQVVLQSDSGHKTCLDSNFSLKFPFKNGRQKTPLETDVRKQTTVYRKIQIRPGTHMDISIFDTLGGKKEQALPEPEQEESILESFQNSLSFHWTFPTQSEDLEGKNKTDTSTTINLEQKPLEMEEGELKIDTNIVICLERDKTEMHKCIIVDLEENIKRDARNTANQNTPSPKAEESPANTQVITRLGNSCPIKRKHKKDLEVPGAKQNIQPQKMFQKHILDSFYAYIPLSLKFEGRKGRLTIADLKRELSPKYLAMKIQNHPVSQILNNTGRGTPSNRKKLEYDFSRPKKTVLWREDTSGICIRSLSVSPMSSSQTEETVESETNLEREKMLCLSEFQQKSPNTSDIKRNSASIGKEGCLPFFPLSESGANLSSETKGNILIPQTKEETELSDPDSSRIRNEPDLIMTEEEEKAPKPILMLTECPLMSDDPKDKQGDKSEPIQDTTPQKVQQQKAFPGTGPEPSQVKSNEIKVMAESITAESILPLYEAIKNIFESQIKHMIQDTICEDILEKVKAHKTDAQELPSFAGSPDIISTIKPPKLQPKPILECLPLEENNKLTNHLESKAVEIKLNLIPEVAKKSFQKFSLYLKQSISEQNSWRLHRRPKKVCFLPLEGIDTIEPNLKQKYPKDSPLVCCMKTSIVNVSSGDKEIITNQKSVRKLGSGALSVTCANEMPLTPILQNYSAEEKDKLLIHFSIKTLEIQMKAFPRIVRESYTMAGTQNTKKPLSKFVTSDVKAPKQKNKVLLLFEEKSLHQIDLDLRYKYLHFLLGLSVKSMFSKPNALPKHILKLNTAAVCKNIENRGESGGGLCTDTEQQHISSKKQSPHGNSSLMKKLLEPTHACASNPNQQGTAQKDSSTVLSELRSHVTPEKNKQCHVWFQETDTYKSVDPKTQESTPSLVDSHSVQISEDFTESQTDIQSPANLEECSALDVYGSEECLFIEARPYLSQESQNILFELQRGIPLENFYKMRKNKTNLKPFYREDSGSHHHIRSCRKHSSSVTPSYESHKSGKYRSSDKMPFPAWLCHGSLSAVDIPSKSSSIPFSEEKPSWTTGYRTSYSLVPLTESNIKLHLTKSQGKPYRHLESKERKKAKLDLFRKNNMHWDCDYSYTQNKEKCTRKKNVCNYEFEKSNHYPGKPKLPSKPHREDLYFHFERKQNQPFFYACIPADSLEIMPQTIRWTIPPRTLKKTNFRVPLVAKISSSCNIWTSSKKLLGSLLESFSLVHPN